MATDDRTEDGRSKIILSKKIKSLDYYIKSKAHYMLTYHNVHANKNKIISTLLKHSTTTRAKHKSATTIRNAQG